MTATPVSVNSKIQSGTLCFAGTRVPVSSLFDHIEQGYTLEEFLADFPSVERRQVIAVLELVKLDMPRHAVLTGK